MSIISFGEKKKNRLPPERPEGRFQHFVRKLDFACYLQHFGHFDSTSASLEKELRMRRFRCYLQHFGHFEGNAAQTKIEHKIGVAG